MTVIYQHFCVNSEGFSIQTRHVRHVPAHCCHYICGHGSVEGNVKIQKVFFLYPEAEYILWVCIMHYLKGAPVLCGIQIKTHRSYKPRT